MTRIELLQRTGGKLKVRGVYLCTLPKQSIKLGLHNIVVTYNLLKARMFHECS